MAKGVLQAAKLTIAYFFYIFIGLNLFQICAKTGCLTCHLILKALYGIGCPSKSFVIGYGVFIII